MTIKRTKEKEEKGEEEVKEKGDFEHTYIYNTSNKYGGYLSPSEMNL